MVQLSTVKETTRLKTALPKKTFEGGDRSGEAREKSKERKMKKIEEEHKKKNGRNTSSE
jgi:hypothetical protein